MTYQTKPVFKLPPLDGTVVLPEVIDFHSKNNADLPMYAFSEDGKNEPTTISFLEFSRACHRVAHALRPNRAGPENQVVAFIALADTVLYQAVTVGLVKAGLVVRLFNCSACCISGAQLTPSPRPAVPDIPA